MGNPDTMACVDLIRPIVFSARLGHQEKLGRMKKPQEFALLTLFVNGCGIVGWHGYVGAAFLWTQQIIIFGGQFVAHSFG